MLIEETLAPSKVEDYIHGVVRLAAAELKIPMPAIGWFKRWTGHSGTWYSRDLEGDDAFGYARPGENFIALRRDVDLDRMTHVALHEVRHLWQGRALAGQAGESDACRFAREFCARRGDEVFNLMTVTRVVEDSGGRSTRCWCEE